MSSSQRKSSRPSSAASHSSRTSTTHHSEKEIKLECKAVYLGRYDDIREEIESKEDLINLLQQTGRNISSRGIKKYWTQNTGIRVEKVLGDLGIVINSASTYLPGLLISQLTCQERDICLRDGLDQFMTFDDFVDICKREPVTSEDDLMRAFRKIDVNGDGYISLDELFKVMTSRGEKMSRSEVKALIDEVDENKDGRLDYEEFSKMIVSSTEDFKKISIKVMEKREKKKRKGENENGSITPRKDKDGASLGSQLSITSSVSEKRHRRSRHNSSSSRKQYDNASIEAEEFRGSGHKEYRPRSSGKGGRMKEPGNLNDWTNLTSKGTFFLDDDHGLISHAYSLNLTEDSEVWITIQPLKIAESGESLDGTIIDTALFVLSEDDNSLIAFTETRDGKGKYGLRCNLSMGSYSLIPFTTGCRLKSRKTLSSKESKLVTKDREGKIVITRSFRKALEEIFEMADLDNNGLLSRQEFNWYNLRTSGEDVADDEWQVVEDNIELERGEITRTGFIKLNEMEADDNEGDTEDLWITLSGMGFNKSLILDEACPFIVKVFARDCNDPDLMVTSLESHSDKINDAVCELVTLKGTANKVKGMRDLTIYTFQNDYRGIIVIENKSRTRVKMELDCSRSKGLVSHTGNLVTNVTVPAQSTSVGLHLLPLDDHTNFYLACEETILK